MLALDPKDNMKDGKMFRHGVIYDPRATNTGINTPDPNMLKMNHTSKLGKKLTAEDIRNKNEKYQRENQKEIKRHKKLFRQHQRANVGNKILDFNLRKMIPIKLISFINNLPEFSPKKIYSYLRAEYSNIEQGPVPIEVYEERKKICGECPHRKQVKGYDDPLGFCTKCGCGSNPRAQLTVKLRLPATSCPIDKWDESQGIYTGFWGRIRYILRRRRKYNGTL